MVKDDAGNIMPAAGVLDTVTGEITTEMGDKIPGHQVVSMKTGETGWETTGRRISETKGKARETGVEGRATKLIDRGLLAAESTASLRRGVELLKTVKTGGFHKVANSMKRIAGVETGDEAELVYSMSKAVLSQLRETFGAAFTAEEGKSLARIEAGFGKSSAGNERLLKRALRIAERTARRAKRSAKDRGDMATVEDIDELLTFDLGMTSENRDPSEMSIEEIEAELGGL
jgi:hypothetical protein